MPTLCRSRGLIPTCGSGADFSVESAQGRADGLSFYVKGLEPAVRVCANGRLAPHTEFVIRRGRGQSSGFLLALMSVHDARQAMFPCGREATVFPRTFSGGMQGFGHARCGSQHILSSPEEPMPPHSTHAQDHHHAGQPAPVGAAPAKRPARRKRLRPAGGLPADLGNSVVVLVISITQRCHAIAPRSFITPLFINRESYHESDQSVRP